MGSGLMPARCERADVADRLNALDASFLYIEGPTTPMHVGSVAIFQAPDRGFDHDRLVALISARIAYVPRYRQRLRSIPGRLGNPVWVDDENFDVAYHVRRSALPRPGTDAQLRELVGRIMSRPLDRSRPLWEVYLVEGLQGGRVAILSKTHHALVDGISAVDIGQVLLDVTPEPRDDSPAAWRPAREPRGAELMVGALADVFLSPKAVVGAVKSTVSDTSRAGTSLAKSATGLLSAAWNVARPPETTPLNVEIGEQRRFGMAATDLDDYKAIRKAHGGTINDVVLAVVTGALREWMQLRGETVTARTTVRAMVPVSVRTDDDRVYGNRVASFLVDLPVGEPHPVLRLNRISYDMAQHKQSNQMVGAEALVGLAGFSPPTLHSIGARMASQLSRRVYNLVVTNVPGPQFPLYAAGAPMIGAYPVVPLAKGQALSIGATSYNGGMFYGLNVDRDAMPDVDELAQFLVQALAELKQAPTARQRRPRAAKQAEA
jgi:WS/DGAT/MGAT family acyltransferase